MMKKNTSWGASLLMYFLLAFQLLNAQAAGDFRSKISGDWITPGTWEKCTSMSPETWVASTTDYPGKTAGSYSVTIVNCHTISTPSSPSAFKIGDLTVSGVLMIKSQLTLSTTNKLWIKGGSMVWADKIGVYLANNAALIITGPKLCSNTYVLGLDSTDNSTCNANTALFMGDIKYTSCVGKGKGNTAAGDFNMVNGLGGSLRASPGAYPSALCYGSAIQPTLFGNAVQYGTNLGVITYTWSLVSKPSGSGLNFPTTNTRNPVLPALTVAGDYVFKLVTSIPLPFSNEQLVTITVGGETVYKSGVWSADIPSFANHRTAKIQENYNTASEGSFDACSCEVALGSTLTVSKDTFVQVLNNITNYGTVTVESDGNLIQVNDNGIFTGQPITSKREFKISATREQYNFVGSPVAFQSGESYKTIYPGTTYVLYHNETNNMFYNSSGVNVPGRGLAVKEPTGSGIATVTATYKGVPQNGIITLPITNKDSNPTVTTYGYNLVGNPYPSNIDLQLLYNINGGKTGSSQIISPNISPTFYFWNNNGNTLFEQQGSGYSGVAYAIYNVLTGPDGTGTQSGLSSKVPSKIVKVGQGFMTRSLKSNYDFIFNNSIRTKDASPVDFLGKGSPALQVDRYWLQMKTPSGIASTIAVVHYAAGNNLFGPEDSRTMGGSDAVYSLAGGEKLAIDGRSSFENTAVIQLGMQHLVNGDYTISIDTAEGIFAEMQPVYLKDKQTGTITNLSQGTYTFSANAGESTGRFEIIYQSDTFLVTDSTTREELVVYRDGTSFVVKAQNTNIKDLELYDLTGRLLYKVQPNSTTAVIDSGFMVNGIYILKIDHNGRITAKKIIK
ncbi:T9SS type A sorting domain-containing protein [Chryseobacterium gotjawalense]|uniref:T9SS type A sorting domain-containing protein n=1 Tax=Chryseobacterium gotjawalense TaxID=3042315 RepID=A0ABY8RI63_9FLAO|nr:T9SS type A sorting domain-containing protein [Chryseobacterium sp. wdc7]WHF53073.1 T9SS type A sorting domain-containing protein [Chryseobacterium sp. wdc7]